MVSGVRRATPSPPLMCCTGRNTSFDVCSGMGRVEYQREVSTRRWLLDDRSDGGEREESANIQTGRSGLHFFSIKFHLPSIRTTTGLLEPIW